MFTIALWILGGMVALTLVFEIFRGAMVWGTIKDKKPEDSWIGTIATAIAMVFVGGFLYVYDE